MKRGRQESGDLLRKRLSHREMSELAATCGSLPVAEKDWSEFEYSLLLEMVWVFLKSGDHDSLVTLFSNRFPSRYHFMDIEELLVLHGKGLKDPILILGEAYSKTQYGRFGRPLHRPFAAALRVLEFAGTTTPSLSGTRCSGTNERRTTSSSIPSMDGTIEQMSLMPISSVPSLRGSRRLRTADRRNRKEARRFPPLAAQVKSLKTTTNSIGMKMALIRAGEFIMGSPEDEKGHDEDESPQHPVRITQPFWLGMYEVTQEEYENIMGKNPSLFSPKGGLVVRVTG